MGKIHRMIGMTWVDVEALDKARTVVLLPLSPIEAHGPHLPVGTDILAASDVADLAAEMASSSDPTLELVLAPPIPLGCADVTADFPGTISLNGQTLFSVVRDICSALAASGFRHIVICNHHLDPIHMKAILSAADRVGEQHGIGIVETASRIHYGGMETEDEKLGRAMGLDMKMEIHADVKETSYIQHRHPGLLKGNVGLLPPVLIDVKAAMRNGEKTFRRMGAREGYLGSPSLASESLGRIHLESQAASTAELALLLANGGDLPVIDPRYLRFLEERVGW
ncbi:MAG: creatininase family protein [Desulfobacterales bacterium]